MVNKKRKKTKIAVLLLGAVLIGFFIGSFFISSEVKVTTEMIIQAPSRVIFTNIVDLKKWEDWSVWNKDYYQDKRVNYFFITNHTVGVDKKMAYRQEIFLDKDENISDKTKYNLSVEVVKTKSADDEADKSIELVYELVELGIKGYAEINISPINEVSSQVVWSYQGDYSPIIGINPLQRYLLLFTESSLRDSYKASLIALKKQLEGES